jgi:DNA polymerase-3 subunit gamma/tau
MTLYRKYRSQKLSELVGQPQVASILTQAISTKRIAHAYLFSGPRGTGKTSVARILAKAINCLNETASELPCNECANCLAINQGSFLDVVEIDAASHRGIDDVRELVEQAQSVPSIGRYKVYILDEVHMFTREAFNALLKTLEEPPAHVVIILCTTESHKVPVTIASRCQRFVFSGANQEQLQQLLGNIAKSEKVAIEPEAIALLARLADGGFRDGVMLLDQVITSSQQNTPSKSKSVITKFDIEQQLGLANQEVIQRVIESLIKSNSAAMVQAIEEFAATGGEVRYLVAGLVEQLRDMLFYSLKSSNLAKQRLEQQRAWMEEIVPHTTPAFIAHAIKCLIAQSANSSLHPTLAVELSLLEALAMTSVSADQNMPTPVVSPQTLPPKAPAKATQAKSEMAPPGPRSAKLASVEEKPASQPEPVNSSPPESITSPSPPANLTTAWQQTLTAVLNQNKSVGSLLRHHCTPVSLDGTILMLQFWNAFHKKQVELDKNRLMVEGVAAAVFGHPIKIRGELADKSLRPKRQPMAEEDLHNVAPVEPDSDLVDTALEMFGGELIDEE